MRKLDVKNFDARRYKKYLDRREMDAIAGRKLEQTYWQKRRRSKVLYAIYRMACKKQKCSMRHLGERILQLSNSRTRAIQRATAGEIPRFEKWLFACTLAGIPTAEAVVLWARESIPDHFSEYKHHVGVTLKRRKLKEMDWQADPTEEDLDSAREAYSFLKDEIGLEYGATSLPDEPKDLFHLGR